MFGIGGFPTRDCQGFSRRSFLQAGASLPLAMGLPSLLPQQAEAAPRRARSVLLVWLWGAPSHLDTFDPKPGAPTEYRGPFSPIATSTPGVQFTELLPKLAARHHRFAVIRSNKTFDGAHPKAGTWGLTGFDEADRQPNFGAVVARHRGYGDLPPFFSLGRGVPRDLVRPIDGYGGASWGTSYDPLMVNCNALGKAEVPSLKLLDGLAPDRLADRKQLLIDLDRIRRFADRRVDGAPAHERWDNDFRRAYDLLTSREAQQALDLSRESQTTREDYGQTSFGQSLLMGRRLIEAGVPYVQVNWSQYVEAMSPNCDFGWDTHIYNFELLPDRHCPILDRAFSALLDDLHQRGLLDSTLVVCLGEFGRTPKINNRAARDHWPNCYFSLWAGAGVQGGRVIGQSDKLGGDPITDPITPLMVGTTLVDAVGVDTVARAELKVLEEGRKIDALF